MEQIGLISLWQNTYFILVLQCLLWFISHSFECNETVKWVRKRRGVALEHNNNYFHNIGVRYPAFNAKAVCTVFTIQVVLHCDRQCDTRYTIAEMLVIRRSRRKRSIVIENRGKGCIFYSDKQITHSIRGCAIWRYLIFLSQDDNHGFELSRILSRGWSDNRRRHSSNRSNHRGSS